MEKLYNDYQYAEKAVEANTNGQKLYIYVFERDVDINIPDFIIEDQEVEVSSIDKEGNTVVTTEIKQVKVPVMIQKEVTETIPVLDEEGNPKLDENGNTITQEIVKIVEVQSTHVEQIKKQFAELLIAPKGYYICYEDNYTDGTINENYEQEQQIAERTRLDSLTLTPSDVERALYKSLGMDFEDLKVLIQEKAPQIDIKAIAIELRANLFYRGATLVNGLRLIDTVGALLGYSSEDMDYLFLHKELPVKEASQEPEE